MRIGNAMNDSHSPSQPENRSLKGIWADTGFESVEDLEATIRSVRRELQASIERRIFGMDARLFSVPDDFDDPLPEEILQSFGA